jgi:hypothetical protein
VNYAQRGQQLLSPAAAAAELGCAVWLVHALCRRGVLRSVRVDGHPRISRRELNAFTRTHRPPEAA